MLSAVPLSRVHPPYLQSARRFLTSVRGRTGPLVLIQWQNYLLPSSARAALAEPFNFDTVSLGLKI